MSTEITQQDDVLKSDNLESDSLDRKKGGCECECDLPPSYWLSLTPSGSHIPTNIPTEMIPVQHQQYPQQQLGVKYWQILPPNTMKCLRIIRWLKPYCGFDVLKIQILIPFHQVRAMRMEQQCFIVLEINVDQTGSFTHHFEAVCPSNEGADVADLLTQQGNC